MDAYVVLMRTHDGDLQARVTLHAHSTIGAMEEALWEYGEDYWILAVWPTDELVLVWRLINANYWQSKPAETYETLEEAIANHEDDGEILIAIPA